MIRMHVQRLAELGLLLAVALLLWLLLAERRQS